jgi:post-segregation antitoxin (ccd killing protein)
MNVKLNITVPEELRKRIKNFKKGILSLNISRICSEAIKKELDKLENDK